MADRREQKARDQKCRIVFAEHRKRSRRAGGDRPSDVTLLKGPQEAIGGDRPGRQQNGVGIKTLRMKLVGRHQHEKQQHDHSLVAAHEAPRNQINHPQRDRRIGQCQQLE